ncbi:alpha/beta-hydrolase, partial [Ceraceosorus guamensis]
MSLNAVTTPARGDPLREDILIPSEGGECHAWWYPPKSGKRGPAIVIGHGLGGIKEMGLNRYAELFQRAGYGALAFDYVGFGQSTGKPRQILDYWKQQGDWDHVLAHAKTMPLIDAYKIGIFGTSFGGAHVIDVAARDPDVVVAISQCPFTSGFASTLTTGFAVPFLGVLGIADTLFGWYKRVNVTVAGKPGQ